MPCESGDVEAEDTSLSSAVNPSELDKLKDRIAQLESLLTSTKSPQVNTNTTPALSPDTLSTSSRSEPPTPATSTYSNESRDKSTKTGSGYGVYEITMQPKELHKVAQMSEAIPDIRFFTKSDAMQYMSSYIKGVFIRNRYAYVDEFMDTFAQIYSSSLNATDAPLVPATPQSMTIYIGLLLGMYPDSIKAFSAYLAVKPTIRSLWSHLSLETLNMILTEAIFLTSTGRLDEGLIPKSRLSI